MAQRHRAVWLLESSLANRLLVPIAMAYGAWTLLRTPVDVFPDLNKPTVTVMTEAGDGARGRGVAHHLSVGNDHEWPPGRGIRALGVVGGPVFRLYDLRLEHRDLPGAKELT